MQCAKCKSLLNFDNASFNISPEMPNLPMFWRKQYLPIKPTQSDEHCDSDWNSIVTLNIVI